jgi:hypothetical protein
MKMDPRTRDWGAVDQAVNFARRWAKDWATWCICVEFILREWENE